MSCLLIGTVTDLALVMEEHRAAHRIAGLALVQPGMAMLAQVGYLDEMNAAEAAIAAGRTDELPTYLTDRWLADCTLYGPAARVREGVEQWREAGITTLVLVPLSPDGNQMNGLKAVFAAFER